MATVKKSLKAVDSSKKPGLAKLSTAVRNKMGYAQNGREVTPKGYVRGEMTNRLYKKEDMDKQQSGMADALDRQAGLGKYASKKNDAINNKPLKEGKPKMKSGGMLKRADGSYSKRGLWDNIRANKGSGKKPTAQMLKQEKKIKAKSK
jgi:hypothetical protein